MLNLVLLGCRACILYAVVMNVFLVYDPPERDMKWFEELRVGGRPIVRCWSADLLSTNESLLAGIVQTDTRLLGTLPSYFFDLVDFSAGFNIGTTIISQYYTGSQRMGSTVPLVFSVHETLSSLDLNLDDPAKRCANILHRCLTAWKSADRDWIMRMREGHLLQQEEEGLAIRRTHSSQQQPPSSDISNPLLCLPWLTSNSGIDSYAVTDFIPDEQYWPSFL
jgi:hypothetical protein